MTIVPTRDCCRAAASAEISGLVVRMRSDAEHSQHGVRIQDLGQSFRDTRPSNWGLDTARQSPLSHHGFHIGLSIGLLGEHELQNVCAMRVHTGAKDCRCNGRCPYLRRLAIVFGAL